MSGGKLPRSNGFADNAGDDGRIVGAVICELDHVHLGYFSVKRIWGAWFFKISLTNIFTNDSVAPTGSGCLAIQTSIAALV